MSWHTHELSHGSLLIQDGERVVGSIRQDDEGWHVEIPNAGGDILFDGGTYEEALGFVHIVEKDWTITTPVQAPRFVSGCCQGEQCFCGDAAEHKVEETIFDDDPIKARHPLTTYVCHRHFRVMMGPAADRPGWP